jgi:type IV secretory pathway TraG/TraD family ATPase VirD4
MLIHISMDNISKRIKSNLLKDRFNVENESFEQSRKAVKNAYSINIPMRFYFKKKIQKGWLNIVNPFRATLLIGTPGSGKTFSIIIPYIKQHLAKGFSMLVYDFKYPDLARITYHHYVKNRKQLNGHQFHMINLNHLEYSRRINPLKPEYILTLADASETAEALIEALRKTDRTTGADQFFSQSAINFLASVIFFFTRHENGKYSTLAHVLSFLNHDYKSIFKVLFSEMELESLLSPFKSAFEQKAFDQLEGQVGTLKINLSRLATKETFWVFSGDDFNLKISDMKDPGILVIANDPDTQSINSACYSVVMNRLIRLINKKGNMPTSLIVDEVPTLYIHKIENLIATARSNQVAVLMGLQELPQFKQQYGKEAAETICAVAANVISGSARNKETLDWLEKLFGKVRQVRSGLSIDRTRTSVSMNEYMDNLIPASKIAALKAGELVAQIGREADQNSTLSIYHCKVDIDPDLSCEKKNNIGTCQSITTLEAGKKRRPHFVII